MKKIISLTPEQAKKHFLKGTSYSTIDFPDYISFEPILGKVDKIIGERDIDQFCCCDPKNITGVNYSFLANKDGRFAWRPYELIHPVLYVSIVNLICEPDNWSTLQRRFSEFEGEPVECCSIPVISQSHQKDVAEQIRSWWLSVEQRSLAYSLEYSHILHTDVTDCYGSLYTQSIPWAIHGQDNSKEKKAERSLLGNKIETLIQAGRHGQTNGIPQGSVLTDFIAELVLGFVDHKINLRILSSDIRDVQILRYRDDYRIFANSNEMAEKVLQIVSQELLSVGMKLGVSKTISNRNVVEGSIKPDKLAGIELQDLGNANAKTIQKQLLRLHSFGQRFPNSGALKRLVSDFHKKISKQKKAPDDLEVQIAIATDIGFVSPLAFPAVAGILSYLISLAPPGQRIELWEKVRNKMARLPHNSYVDVWLQRVIQPLGMPFESQEPICKIVNGESVALWENGWISDHDLQKALNTSTIVTRSVDEMKPVIEPEEIELFTRRAWSY
ncbi:RNA-directed DNA polymerase [Bellilinea sp.]|uniref:RNA-directed DNA polymerase n=1 Tax=Bellilinea caldifistulae TaxID=360411 RepID=A0A7C4Q9Y7_9CHLR|nr:RNA-directed DNA polymerase [Bellilinea sp.]